MPSVVKCWRPPGLFLLGSLLSVFGPLGYAADSVTNTCRQNPAYCALLNGQEAGAAPTVRSGAEIASIAATLRFLSPELKLRIERTLHECAAWADAEVNRRRLGGNTPSRQQCQEVLPTLDPCGQKVTRAMQWGTEKHGLATQCVQVKFPCPADNEAIWRMYGHGHTYKGLNQGQVYVEALKSEASLVTPRRGIEQRIHP